MSAPDYEFPYAELCEATREDVIQFEEDSGDRGCPVCGRSAREHPQADPEAERG